MKFPIVSKIDPDTFDAPKHYYQKVLNSHLHPLVKSFFVLNNNRLINRYCHLHPEVDRDTLTKLLSSIPKHFHWSGCDLFPTSNENGIRNMVVIETNSCPSGQKSFPLFDDTDEMGGYSKLIRESFIPTLKNRRLIEGSLAVIYDKNHMEASGYAATIAETMKEPVYLATYYSDDDQQNIKFEEGILKLLYEDEWIPIRATFKYVTQKPWNRIPIKTKTFVFNPIIACLAGGRNKLVASKAYEFLNGDLQTTGLEIRLPETIWDVSKNEIPLWIERLGGYAVIKDPYSNAGQGVYTITNARELKKFMELEHDYDLFIVQSLIGNSNWSSNRKHGKLYHIGTVPNKKNQFFVADLRMMICSTPNGYRPIAIYARQAREAMKDTIGEEQNSWDILGTNLSVKLGENDWDSETERLLLMDHRDFNKLGLGLDDLIEAFVQSVMANIAIDRMASRLLNQKGRFKSKLFTSLDNDEALMNEIIME